MRSPSFRRTTVIVLVVVFLVPGLLQARTSAWSLDGPSGREGLFAKVWNLLALWWPDTSAIAKNGSGLDPAGQQPPPSGSSGSGSAGEGSGSGDNGSGLDPAGTP